MQDLITNFPDVVLLRICYYLDLKDIFTKLVLSSKHYNTFINSHLRSILLAMNENNFISIKMDQDASPGKLNKLLKAPSCIIQRLNLSQLSMDAYCIIQSKCNHLEILCIEMLFSST